MIRKIEETTAVNEARMDMAMSNVDQQKVKIDDDAEKLQASELVKQFKIEMGLASPQAAAPGGSEKTIAAKEPQRS
jgi:phage shock protein A